MTGNISAKADKAAAKKPKKVSKYSKRKVDPAFYWMTIPAMILVCILPFLQGAMYSFTNSQGYGDYKFIDFKNYIAMFQDARVGHAYLFTIFIAILITLGTNILGMFLAVLLNSKIAFKNGFRAIFFIPYTLSVLVIGYVFKYIFMNPLPALGKALGIGIFGSAWRDAHVTWTKWGAPVLHLEGTFARRAEELGVTDMAVSISHEGGMAAAVVVMQGGSHDTHNDSGSESAR